MNELVKARIRALSARTPDQEKNALREIVQEIALLGLWRGKFFERAAFYGGTALRILYGLDRFSEDLDFTLSCVDRGFTLEGYCKSVQSELAAFGFTAQVTPQQKARKTATESAFIKANTAVHLLRIGSRFSAHPQELLKVKLEVDVEPAPDFTTTVEQFFWPQAFSVRVCDLASLFAGKLHATFCRDYKQNIKGRDWFDLLWYIGRGEQPNWPYLENKLRQSGHWKTGERFDSTAFVRWAKRRVRKVDFELAKKDVERFLPDPRVLEAWSAALFEAALDRLC